MFTKYRLLFKLTKYDFFKPRVEFVGYDLTTYGNYTVASKFDLIQHLPLPPNTVSFLSFTGLCRFYIRYCPWFEMNIKPLRKVQRTFHRKLIPIISWTSSLITLFDDCKNQLVTSPLSLRYDNSKPAFLKTDWSAVGMSYILMKADESLQFLEALTLLEATDEFTFDLSLVLLLSIQIDYWGTLPLFRWRSSVWKIDNLLLP